MDLKSLFEMQKVLDYRIEQEHPREDGEDRLGKKLLALQVELGELANELPQMFKFWSNKKNDYKKALGEYVDGLHFLLSIGLENPHWIKQLTIRVHTVDDIEKQFNGMYKRIVDFQNFPSSKMYDRIFSWYIGLGELLGFTWEQIEHAYLSKNKINHERQNNGY